MVRLFLKLYGPLLLAVFVIVVAQSRVFGYVTYRYGSENVRLSFLGVFNLVERELMRVDPSTWDLAFEGLRADFGHPVALSALSVVASRFPADDARASLLEAGKVVILGEGDGGYSVVRRIGAADRVLVLTFTESRHIRDNLVKLNVVVQVVVLTLLLVFWVWPLLRDMRRLQLVAFEIGSGHFHAPPVLGKWSVLVDLQRAFSVMARQISNLLQSQKALTGGLSHELRNPLMRIQYRHRLALDAVDAPTKDTYLQQMQGDLDSMNGLVNEVLVFSKMEYREVALALRPEALAPLAGVLSDEFEALAAASGRAVSLAVAVQAERCSMDERHMRRAVGNLLANAARFAVSKVTLTFCQDGGYNEIRVEDDGPGIEAVDAERIFRPFERVDESRDRATGGFGLGLAIVREVARLHGGSVRVGKGGLGGASFTIRWPERGQVGNIARNGG
ncbi:MAG: ATP-binding protein [Burkholderiales bacterium]|nr:ATP-binding protein [Burkholderiales bacterium]